MFFILSKLAWAVLQPSNVMLGLVVIGTLLVWTRRWERTGRLMLAVGAIALLVVGFGPVSHLLLAPLENRFPRPDLASGPPVAGIIILGGSEDGRAGTERELAGLNEAGERITEGAVLGLRFPAARVVFTGGNGHLLKEMPPEAVTSGRLLQALGIAKERLVIEDKSRNTWENAVFSKQLAQPKPGERWLLVTSSWHMPRAIGCFRAAGFPVEAWPVDYRLGPHIDLEDKYLTGLRQVDFVTREYIGLIGYYLTGKTQALLPGP
jgi:uncharacterized SAM-binding protein YcdF (DUF218 family)